ncbi:hypothetical protein [Streptomyces apricus]|uniref:Uncharacterized protein n=1 Tax=Streptomyces apricus TaxID=1828112 RepID=A0A5B0A359_9ACTN|nr:hypothetical protein [Streptomyces apricus]KAA0924113.1 hypothetical protein FGF04_33280 [Streptomyces apricus]
MQVAQDGPSVVAEVGAGAPDEHQQVEQRLAGEQERGGDRSADRGIEQDAVQVQGSPGRRGRTARDGAGVAGSAREGAEVERAQFRAGQSSEYGGHVGGPGVRGRQLQAA